MLEHILSLARPPKLRMGRHGNGGAGLVYGYFIEDRIWHSYQPRHILAVTIRRFKNALKDADFLTAEENGTTP